MEKKPKKQLSEDLQKLGKRIRELRIKKGYTNYENFAFEHNIPRAQFGRYEQGHDLRYSSLLKVVRAFGMTMEEFFSKGFE
jgi:transcriptional regulator with XRE-family HTH domain